MLLPQHLYHLNPYVVFLFKAFFLNFFLEVRDALKQGFDLAGLHFLKGLDLCGCGRVTFLILIYLLESSGNLLLKLLCATL
jgi:hypothetical protein